MASFSAVNGTLLALEQFFNRRLPSEFTDAPVSARVELLGSNDVSNNITGNVLGLYLHRIEIDPHGRARQFTQNGNDQGGTARELPINLHLLMIASASSATIEANLLAWAMIELANESQLDISHMAVNDDQWTEREILTVTPSEMTNEDLMRIWHALDRPYTNSVPYVVRTIRLRLRDIRETWPEVITRVFPVGKATVRKNS